MKILNISKTIGLSFVCAALFVGIALLMRNSTKVSPAPDTLVIGMMSGWPPFMSINEQGQYIGFDVDVANLLGKKLGKKVEVKDVGSLATLFLSLEQGKIDMIISGLDVTQERKQRLNIIPYAGDDITSEYVIFYKQVPQGIKSLEDLKQTPGAIVCVEPNSTSEKLIDLYPSITKKQLKSMADMVLDVRMDKSTAFIAEPPVARRLFKKDPDLKFIEIQLPKQLCIYGYGIAVKKENIALATTVARVIGEMRTSGELNILEKKWDLKGEAS